MRYTDEKPDLILMLRMLKKRKPTLKSHANNIEQHSVIICKASVFIGMLLNICEWDQVNTW